jgi:hypothetical protein
VESGYSPGTPEGISPRSDRNRFQIPRVRPGVSPGYSPGTDAPCSRGGGELYCHIKKNEKHAACNKHMSGVGRQTVARLITSLRPTVIRLVGAFMTGIQSEPFCSSLVSTGAYWRWLSSSNSNVSTGWGSICPGV